MGKGPAQGFHSTAQHPDLVPGEDKAEHEKLQRSITEPDLTTPGASTAK